MSALVVTDLDGTLLRSDRSFDPQDLETLRDLGRRGVVRCIATGRNLYSARQVVAPSVPVDYIVFSSGAGLVDWPEGTLLERHLMTASQVARALGVLAARRLDFMVHEPVPENHRFAYYAVDGGGDDFRRRIARYREFASPGDAARFRAEASAQLLAVVSGGDAGEREYREVRSQLEGLSVVRSTSPLDGVSTWIEVFSPSVSKSQAVARVALRHSVPRERALAIGNDYNDEDLLAWAGLGVVVGGAPSALRSRFRQVASNDAGGFTQAVREWGLLRTAGS